MAYKSSARGTRPVRLVAIHTTEGARTAASLGSYFYQDSTQASSHVGIDNKETKPYVPYDRAAWTIRSANPISDNAEICGYAHWTRAQWLSRATVDGCESPYDRLVRAAEWTKARCIARGIPRRWLTPAQVAAGMSGIIGHVDWTVGMNDGTHTDPGTGFPKDVFMAIVAADEGDFDVSDSQYDYLKRLGAETQSRVDELRTEMDVVKAQVDDIHTKVMAYLNSQTAEDLNEDRRTNAALPTLNTKLDQILAKLDGTASA
jgi:N-acetyl-anhydromuramyl-L-alanine amidase AmpD